MSSSAAAGLVGPIVQAGAALALLLVFVILLRFTTQRRFATIWLAAWAAHLIASLPMAIASIDRLMGFQFSTPAWPTLLGLIMVAGQFAFVALLVVGGLDAAGVRLSKRRMILLTAGAFVAGLLVAYSGPPTWLRRIQLFAEPALVFGTAFVVVRAAIGDRERGLVGVGVALTLYGLVACTYLLADIVAFSESSLAPIVTALWRYSGYLDGFTLALMGGAVVVLMVQDAFVEVAQARGDKAQAQAVAYKAEVLSGVISVVVRDLGQPINGVLLRSKALLEVPANAGMTNSLIEIQRQAQNAHLRIENLQQYVRELAETE